MRSVELRVESGDDLDVRSFKVVENLSAAFHIDLSARSRDDAVDLAALLGRRASLRLEDDRAARSWTGVCAHAAQTAVESSGLSTYALRIVPALWLLTHRRNHRLFQHLSVPEIVSKILGEWGIHPALELAHERPKLALRTQYGESDYDFVRRLLAEAGLSFFFRTAPGEDTRVVITDEPQDDPPLAPPIPFEAQATSGASIQHVTIEAHVAPARVTLVDHDFRRPRYALAQGHAANVGGHVADAGQLALLERYHYVPGVALAEAKSGSAEPTADAGGTYRHADKHALDQATRRADGHRANQTRIGFTTSCIELAPGTVFSIDGHPHPLTAKGKKLLVTRAWIEGDVGAAGWHAGGQAVPADHPYRPAVEHTSETAGKHDAFEPVKSDAKPRIHGVESAIVTGPAGEDVHTDEHGRVKVQFPWDREGQRDEKSSPWLRVSQAWAGAGYGVHAVPRVGHEVLVGFHDGDPDHPVVVGRVHDTTAPVPYALPENKHRTSLRSSTARASSAHTHGTGGVAPTPPGSGGAPIDGGTAAPAAVGTATTNLGAGANEITFDDAPGHVLFYMQAENDLHKLVGKDELELTQGSRTIHVDGDLTISAGGKVTITSGKDVVVKGGPKVLLNPKDPPKPAKKPPPLKKAKPEPKPATPKGTGANEEAQKFLGQDEATLQADHVTLPCPYGESCANFVTSMLARTGAIKSSSRTLSVPTLLATLQDDYGWKKVSPEDAKPGDVWIVCQYPSPPNEQHTEIVHSNDNGHITLIGSNNTSSSMQTVGYDAYSANAGMADSYILAPP